MKKAIATLFAALFLLGGTRLQAQPTAVLGAGLGSPFKAPYNQPAGTNRTLSRDTTYILTGFYFVDSTATITIPAGTRILGDSATGATLIIKRGARINANGTAALPIVFTSRKSAGLRKRGDWGGIVILGNAPTNKPTTTQVEGIGAGGEYGGSDANDNSGVFRYVRIEFPGIIISLNNEINGLTMGGVGRGTQIDHVQVSYSNDDSFEWFGGTVDTKYLVAYGGTDDDFDTDFGYSGRLQFLLAMRDSSQWDAAGQSNGFESDNEGTSPYTANPRTSPVFSNVTFIGPNITATQGLMTGNKFEYAAVLRRATELSVHNSILMGYRYGFSLRDSLTAVAALAGRLKVRNTSLQALANVTNQSGVTTGFFNVATWLTDAVNSNTGIPAAREASTIGLVAPFNFTNPNPSPSPTLEAATAGTSFAGLDAAFFTPTTYRGAFEPGVAMSSQWTAGWTSFNPITSSVRESQRATVPASFTLAQNYPNPFNPSTNIRFEITKNSFVTLKVHNLLGQEVATLVNQQLDPGSFEADFNAANLASGSYVYRLSADGSVLARKMLLMK